jgi:formamidopyrimidine-DNA glycosylase
VHSVSGVDWPRMLPNSSAEEMHAVLLGLAVETVGRRGKYLLLGFEDDRWLAIHRKMSGNLLLREAQAPAEPHTHFELVFHDGTRLRFVDARKFGRVYLFHSRQELDAFVSARLGLEPLTELDARSLSSLLRGRRGRLKSLLLDQAFIAGVGNLYADEALWQARLHPLRSADTLSAVEIKRLARAVKDVLAEAIERRGTSFSNYRDADDAPGENQTFLNVYGRGSEPCPRCGTPISRIVIGSRSAHFCKRCQRTKPPGASGSALRT